MNPSQATERPPDAMIRFPERDYNGAINDYQEAKSLVAGNGLYRHSFLYGRISSPMFKGKEGTKRGCVDPDLMDQIGWQITMPFWWDDMRAWAILKELDLPNGAVLEFKDESGVAE